MVERLSVATEYFMSRKSVTNGEVLCCDRAILCRNIVGRARKIFCRDGVG